MLGPDLKRVDIVVYPQRHSAAGADGLQRARVVSGATGETGEAFQASVEQRPIYHSMYGVKTIVARPPAAATNSCCPKAGRSCGRRIGCCRSNSCRER